MIIFFKVNIRTVNKIIFSFGLESFSGIFFFSKCCFVELTWNQTKLRSAFFSVVFFCGIMSDHRVSKAPTVYPAQMKHQVQCDVL